MSANTARGAAVAAFACAVILGVTAVPATALTLTANPFVQQGEKLTSAEVTELAEQGHSVALSANGDTALIGSPAYKELVSEVFAGAAWVYVRSGSTWTLQAKLVGKEGSGDAQQGHSVALSADGDTALVGGPEDEGENEDYYGAAWVFRRNGTKWEQVGKKLVASGPDATQKASQGSSVALSANGETALIGAEDNEEGGTRGVGAAFVFKSNGSEFKQQGGPLVGHHGTQTGLQGWSVALSGNGDTALIGGPKSEGEKGEREAGAAWVFAWTGSEWKEQAKLPQGTGTGLETGQGESVALSGDGDTALVGGPGYKDAIGGAWVYVRNGEKWEQQGPPLQGNDAGTLEADDEGLSVALSEDGDTALIGGPADDVSLGAAWAFVRSGSTWSEQEKLGGTGAVSPSSQGASVALSADGGTALVGAPGDNGERGATWVFARKPESSGEKEPPQEELKEQPKEEPKPNQPPSVSTGAGAGSSGGGTPSGGPRKQPPPAPTAAELEARLATAFGLPSAEACYSKRSFKIHIQQPPGYPKVVSAEVFLGATRERSLNKQGLTDQVVLKQLPYGTFTIRIVARTAAGGKLTGTRTYHTCRAKPLRTHHHPRL
jgi:hypothetical protein